MELVSFGGFWVVLFDMLFIGVVLVSVILAIWHIFDKSVGTDLDWLVSLLFILCAGAYDYIIRYTITIHWDRCLEFTYILIYYAIFAFLLWLALKEAHYYSVTDTQ